MCSIPLAYYGDDFSGSTDVMEALTRAGLTTVLFLDVPDQNVLRRFPDAQVVGVAGTSRSMGPAEMKKVLPDVFQRLAALGPKIVHYKICSTFDSSPTIGSIGLAMDIGRSVLSTPIVPLVVGVPVLGRYTAFGNLFARSGLDTEPFRLDRHPTMRYHPTTPMTESDLRVVLAEQTSTPVHLVDVVQLSVSVDEVAQASGLDRYDPKHPDPARILLFDVLYDEHLAKIGRLVWDLANHHSDPGDHRPLFAVGSSGLTYALTAHWLAANTFSLPQSVELPDPQKVFPTLVLSGSCSPVTARQIQAAVRAGVDAFGLDTPALIDPRAVEQVVRRAVSWASERLAQGRSVILHTCLGPQDERIGATEARLQSMGFSEHEGKLVTARTVGQVLGRLARQLTHDMRIARIVLAGGDTSGYAAQEMGIEALEMIAPLLPGSPLCRIHASGQGLHGVEVAFKGGQTGRTEFLVKLLSG